MADAFFPDGSTVWISAAGGAPTTGFQLTSHATNFSESGGNRDTESIPVFGGGNVTKENPREQIEVSFDVIVQPALATIFDEMLYSSTISGTAATTSSSGEGTAKKLQVKWTGGGKTYTRTYDNCYLVSWEPEMGADEYLKGSITFKLSPTTSAGVANLVITYA